MNVPDRIKKLTETFDYNLETYKKGSYNETQVRREFIDPFFQELGWDITNKQGYAEAYKDVIHEDAIKIGGVTKAPDYCFRIGGARKFFLEAKKPSVNIREDIHPAYQLRRYGWSAKLPLSILTDFEEFSVYDCRVKPAKTDKAPHSRILYLKYTDYIDKWDEIANIFSREAILRGSFDKYVESNKTKKGTAEVDTAFLQEIERWRELLARNIALRNPDLTQRELNFAIQRTIDRIIFLRICEDRGIEDYGRLMALKNGENVYKRLFQLFRKADDKYNSGLFHFKKEINRDNFDNLTPSLAIDDKTLKDIFKNLYYPDSPYEFSVLSADILGQIYEKFLGKIIRLTPKHQAKIEEKPEVRKAGGVYYTPTYIVDYIVKQTVGKLVEGKKPGPRGAVSKFKILDPACGSGSFLIGAYQYLLDWHRDQYVNDGPEKWAKGKTTRLYKSHKGEWRLTTDERKRILLNNIYGVDIDHQAVEVTKLSLLLKVLEGEDEQSIGKQMLLFQERVLPDLSNNIKCGNSLIGPDFYEEQQMSLLGEEEMYRINVFDWKTEFPEIMQAGGFNAVIGNPPYGAWFKSKESEYFTRHFNVFGSVKDVYTCFIEKGLGLLKQNGKFSVIIPSAWIGGPKYTILRFLLIQNQIDNLILLPFDIFPDAYVDTTIIVLSNQVCRDNHKVKTYTFGKREKLYQIDIDSKQYKLVQQRDWQTIEDNKFILDPESLHLIQKLKNMCAQTVKNIVLMKRGVLFDKSILTKSKKSKLHYSYFEGNVYRYTINIVVDNWVEFGNKMKERPKDIYWFEGPRILLRRLVNRQQRLMATYTNHPFITNKNLYTILVDGNDPDIRVALAILNSKLASFLYLRQVTQATKDDFPQVTIKDILALPFPSKTTIAKEHDRMVELVEQMLDFNKQIAVAKTPQTKTVLQRQIETTDRQIDRLVYKLYKLTDEEIKIVESET